MSLPVQTMVHSGDMASVECILCGNCDDGCKQKAIGFAFGVKGKDGVAAANTPDASA